MPRLLILSSVVSIGHVGASAGQPVCTVLGLEVTTIPTIQLSNHPGWPHVAGNPVPADRIDAMADALARNGWLGDHDALLLGYMPGPDHVTAAASLAVSMKKANPALRIVVDPILGDAPKGLYVSEAVASAVRDRLVPLADCLTPNLFELQWLSARTCTDLRDCREVARALGPGTVHVTSPPLADDQTGVLSVTAQRAQLFRTPRLPAVPHGVGDVLATLIAAGVPVGQAAGHLLALARASAGQPHLRIVPAATTWASAPAIPAEDI